MFFQILFYVFLISAIIQIGYWLLVFSRIAFYKSYQPSAISYQQTSPKEKVSVVICAHNEEKNIAEYLPYILEQDYPIFEVVVVNDDSKDKTLEVLTEFQKVYQHLKFINICDKQTHVKKAALAEGIRNTQYELLLLTDADCQPATKNWIREMSAHISESPQTEIVLGYGPYKKYPHSFLNLFIRYETVWTAIQYIGFALAGFPYMGVGRNLMYRKINFEKNKNFFSKSKLISGDDDLFVNNFITNNNFSVCICKDSFMWSEPKKNWKSFFLQKIRHLSTGTSYKTGHKILLGLLSTSHFLFFVTALCLSLLKISTIFVTIIYVARLLVLFIICERIFEKFSEKKLLLWLPILDFALVIYYIIMLPSLFIKTKNWK